MHIEQLEYILNRAIKEAELKRNKLIIVPVKEQLFEQAIENLEIPQVNINYELSRRLMDIPIDKRSRKIAALINDIIGFATHGVVALMHYDILFLPELKQDPLRMFEQLSKETTIILLWKGKYEKGILSHAEPWHREYREYSDIDAQIIDD